MDSPLQDSLALHVSIVPGSFGSHCPKPKLTLDQPVLIIMVETPCQPFWLSETKRQNMREFKDSAQISYLNYASDSSTEGVNQDLGNAESLAEFRL
ncbi:MAG: hypothetical protein AXA67_11235 [Methylothermaceae bacteria B42]|nr:MAG: hypothetical protein AXA67_11235 [Methylothermaceae bacteria B42]